MGDKKSEKISYVKLTNEKESKWYYAWVKEHSHGFCVHSIYANYRYIVPVDSAAFYEMDYGMWNSDPFKSFDEADIAMRKKIDTKIKKGYRTLEDVRVST